MAQENDDSSGTNTAVAKDDEWWASVVAASESPEVIEAMWRPRSESMTTWGSRCFDHDLNPLPGMSQDAALEVRLVRYPSQALCRAKFEVRTTLALYARSANVNRIAAIIADAQRELAERWGLAFPAASTAKPHVLTRGRRGLVRAYGKGNIFETQDKALSRLQAYGLLAEIWRAALIDQEAVTLARVRRIAEDAMAEDNMNLRCLFVRSDAPGGVIDERPELTDALLTRVGQALGCRALPDGRYRAPLEPIVVEETYPAGIVRLVAEDLALEQGVNVDTVLRKTLQPMLAGDLDGPVVRLTPTEAAAVRAAFKRRQADRERDPED